MGSLALTPQLLHSILDTIEDHHISLISVCFSPDGKLVATGAKDGVVRVSSRNSVLAIVIPVAIIFEPNAQHRTIFGALDLGYCQGTDLQHIPGSYPGDLLTYFLIGWEIAHLWVS